MLVHHRIAVFCLLISSAACQMVDLTPGGFKQSDPIHGDSHMVGREAISSQYITPTPPALDVTRHSLVNIGEDLDPDISPDGKHILFSSTRDSAHPDIYMKSLHGRAVTRLTTDPADDFMPKFSPNGKAIAYTSNRFGNYNIFIHPIANSQGKLINGRPRQITFNNRNNIHPSWSPTGEELVYCSENPLSGQWEIWIYNWDADMHRQIGHGLLPEWSPTGEQICFQRYRGRGLHFSTIWVMNTDGTGETEILADAKWGAITPTWSPDGQYLAFATIHKSAYAQQERRYYGGDDIWVVDVSGGDLTQVTVDPAADAMPCWAIDAKGRSRIFFCSERDVENLDQKNKNIFSAVPYTRADLDLTMEDIMGADTVSS